VCYKRRILLDLKWGETDENSSEGEDSEGEDRVSENENDSEANEEKK